MKKTCDNIRKTRIGKKIAIVSLASFMALSVVACGNSGDTSKEDSNSSMSSTDSKVELGKTTIPDTICQYTEPVEGEIIAEIVIKDYGTIKVKFFETLAPKAVENFVELSKKGYYDGILFHRVIDDFMIQGGDPNGNGTGGESVWGADFEDEISTHLAPVRGALCMANSGTNTNGSQFFIVQKKAYDIQNLMQLRQSDLDKDVVDYYKANGGAGWLYGAHTVFGQVYEGMDVVDKIAAVEVDAKNKPVNDVIIEKIIISQYS